MTDGRLERLFWRVADQLDYLVTLASLRILDALAGPLPETPADRQKGRLKRANKRSSGGDSISPNAAMRVRKRVLRSGLTLRSSEVMASFSRSRASTFQPCCKSPSVSVPLAQPRSAARRMMSANVAGTFDKARARMWWGVRPVSPSRCDAARRSLCCQGSLVGWASTSPAAPPFGADGSRRLILLRRGIGLSNRSQGF